MIHGWQMLVDRARPAQTMVRDWQIPPLEDGQVLIESSLTAITANSIAYAELGEQLRYAQFFPVDDDRWSTPPMWGFADVVESRVDQIAPGTRVYGFIPSASHAVLTPQVLSKGRFRDIGGRRRELPPSYSNYHVTTHDESYFPADREDVQVVFRPLFITSWALADFLTETVPDGDTFIVSSASSKTAYGAALSLRARADDRRILGLTSAGNADFVRALDCYDGTITYDELDEAAIDGKIVYVDLAGSHELRRRLKVVVADRLLQHVVVGLTHHEGVMEHSDSGGPQPEFWFCPDHLKRRGAELGPGVLHTRFSTDYRASVPTLTGWANFTSRSGPRGLQATWQSVIAGTTSSGSANVVVLNRQDS